MAKVRVAAFGVSLDGYGAGPDQSLENPLGVGFPEVMGWVFPTRFFRTMHGGQKDGETGVDNTWAEKSFVDVGSWILGRNMFGPVRGAWPDDRWKGWWGEEPPYHCQVFVLTHHTRPALRMKGGTDFHFVTGGIHEALARAKEAAAGRDVRIGGGVATVRQYLQARLIDELHLAHRPVLMGRGENLYQGLDLRALGYEVAESAAGERATHLLVRRAR
ncbi:MAG: dihydrofolate reductase family protein [Myxococcales bacterium]